MSIASLIRYRFQFDSQKQNRGFTLTELIVVVAILSIICVVGAAIAVNSQNASSYADRKNESLALGRQIIENLRFDSSCVQALGNASVTQTGNPATEMITPSGWEVRVKLEGINSGAGMSGTVISANPASPPEENLILGKRLKVDSLKLADGILLESTAGIDRYLATVYLQTSAIGGISHRPQMLGTLTLNLNASNQIQSCQSITTDAFVNACTDMGCTYNSSLTPPCRCKRSQVVCSAPGFYATSFNAEGIPKCEPAGGKDCPPGEYLAGFGIDEIQCTPAPPTAVVNGLCGPASGNIFANAAAANAAGLCSQGAASPTSLSGPGNWTWDCVGAGGGTNATPQCAATQSAGPACAAQTISNCDVMGGTAVGSSSGTCASGYTGSCSYTCNSGPTWGAPQSNTCVASCLADGALTGADHVFADNSYNSTMWSGSGGAEMTSLCCSNTGYAQSPSCPGMNCSAIDVPVRCGPPAGGGFIGFYLSLSNAGPAPCYSQFSVSQRDGPAAAIAANTNCPYSLCNALGYTITYNDEFHNDYPDTITPYNISKANFAGACGPKDACLIVYDINGGIIDGAGNQRGMLFCKP